MSHLNYVKNFGSGLDPLQPFGTISHISGFFNASLKNFVWKSCLENRPTHRLLETPSLSLKLNITIYCVRQELPNKYLDFSVFTLLAFIYIALHCIGCKCIQFMNRPKRKQSQPIFVLKLFLFLGPPGI